MKPVDQALETSFNGVNAVHGVLIFLLRLKVFMGYDNLKKLKVKNFLHAISVCPSRRIMAGH
jgi:hypothetical protein